MSDRILSRLWVPLSLLYLALTIFGVVLSLWTEGELIHFVQTVPGFTGLAIVGSLLTSRRPRNPVSWLLLCASLAAAAYNAVIETAIYGWITAPGSIPSPFIAAVLAQWLLVGFLILFALSVFLFPNGRLPSRKWRRIVLGVGLISVLSPVALVLGTAEFVLQTGHAPNPLFLPALAPLASVPPVLFLLQLSPLALAVASLVARYRASSTAEKQQLKWILLAAVLMVALFGGSAFTWPFQGACTLVALAILPTAMGIAILRYRLFDIDHLINRTLVYGATSGVIAVLFFVPIVGVQPLLRPFTSGSELEIAGLTLVAFALFQPIRRRIQEAVDRRFDRSRYDAARTLDALSDELRDEVDLQRVEADLLSAVSTTMAPQHLSLWLRGPIPGATGKAVTISGRPVVRKELA